MSKYARVYVSKSGNKSLNRIGHIFQINDKRYIDGELRDYPLWRAVIGVHGRKIWKASKDRAVVERWLDNMLTLFGRKEIVEYGYRKGPEKVRAKYGEYDKEPVLVRASETINTNT